MQEFEFDVEDLPVVKNRTADEISRLNRTGGDQLQEPVDVDVPVLASETDGNEDAADWNPYVDGDNELGITEKITPSDPPTDTEN